MKKSKLLEKWEKARDDLGLEIVAPFEVELSDKTKVCANFLVKNFGAKNGMLIFTDYAIVRPYHNELSSLGYGFSVLDEPRNAANEIYVCEDFIEMLSDWGWSGDKALKPEWIIDLDENNLPI
jgi:hypothetical protein